MDHLDDLLAGAEITLTDEILDRIDAIVPPGTDVGTLDMAYNPPAIQQPPCAGASLANAQPADPSHSDTPAGEASFPCVSWPSVIMRTSAADMRRRYREGAT
jgi:hypothetical protein